MRKASFYTFILSALSILLFALLAAWWYLAYKSSSYKAEIAVVKEEIRAAADRDRYLSSVESVLEDIEDDMTSARARFIREEDVPAFIAFLEDTAKKSGVIATIASIDLEGEEGSRALRMRASGVGSWSETIGFISSLDGSKFAILVENMSLSRGEAGGGWQFSLDLSQKVTD